MNEQDIFEYLATNLKVEIEVKNDGDGESNYKTIQVRLLLTNPINGRQEEISSAQDTM